jgi:hypothetical protein
MRVIPVARRLFALTVSHHLSSHRFNWRLSEWHLAGVMLAVGIMLQSSQTFGLPPYEVVRQIAEQDVWSWTMILIGMGRLVALVVNGHAPRASGHARYVLASMSAFTWALLLAALLSFNTPLMLGPFLAAATVVDLITAFRAAQDAREADETKGERNDTGPG